MDTDANTGESQSDDAVTMYCIRCRYNLNHLTSNVCPECGTGFDPRVPSTYRTRVGMPRWVFGVVKACLIVLVFLGCLLLIVEWRYRLELSAANALAKHGASVQWTQNHRWARDWAPDFRQRLQRVWDLDLRGIRLTAVPKGISRFDALERLHIGFNNLVSLSPEVCEITSLTRLGVDGNQITSLPREMGDLSKLERFSADDNQLAVLPVELWKLSKLKVLSLNANQISTLPTSIGTMTSLESLHLNDNQLTALPAELSDLTTLIELHLRNNPIGDADLQCVSSLTRLQFLDLRGTKVTVAAVDALRKHLWTCVILSDDQR